MSHAPFDRVSASSPLEVVEPSPSESHLQPQSSAYAQIIPHRTHSYAEPNKIPPSSVFGAHVQSQWAMSDTMHQVPETFAPIHNEFTHQFVQDIAPTFGAQNMVHTPWTNTERPDMGAFHRGYLPPSMRGAPLAMFFPRRPTEGFTPLSSPHECHDEEIPADRLRCKWKGCTTPRSYGSTKTLLRHVREKHIDPNVFECPIPWCGKSFSRMDG